MVKRKLPLQRLTARERAATLTADDVRFAARFFVDSGREFPLLLAESRKYDVWIDLDDGKGPQRFAPKVILTLATGGQLKEEEGYARHRVWLPRLEQLGFPVLQKNESPAPSQDCRGIDRVGSARGQAPRRRLARAAIHRTHVERAAHEMLAAGRMEQDPKVAGNRWLVENNGHWFPWQPLLRRAAVLAGHSEPRPYSFADVEGLRWRDRLRDLRFTLNRDEPYAAAVSEAAIRANAARMRQGPDSGPATDPLEIEVDGRPLPLSVALDIPHDAPVSPELLASAEATGFTIRTAPDPLDDELDALIESGQLTTEAQKTITARIGQGQFRNALLKIHGACVLTGIEERSALRAAHIRRWRDCCDEPRARRDPENGLLLSANLDALFEVGLIAFAHDGSILISKKLDEAALEQFHLHDKMRLPQPVSRRRKVYLEDHRERTKENRPGEAG